MNPAKLQKTIDAQRFFLPEKLPAVLCAGTDWCKWASSFRSLHLITRIAGITPRAKGAGGSAPNHVYPMKPTCCFFLSATRPDRIARNYLAAATTLFATLAFAQRVDVISDAVQLTKPGAGTSGDMPVLIPQTPRVKVARTWNEQEAVVRVKVANTFRTALLIQGVQTSGSLYVVNFPTSISAGGVGELEVRYAAGTAGSGNVDVINLLTNQGIKTIEVEHDRESVFMLDVSQLQWKSGDTTAKTVYLAVDDKLVKPTAVRVLGGGKHTAVLKAVNSALYTITITPGATAGKFAVTVDFDPPVEGQAAVIYCEISG